MCEIVYQSLFLSTDCMIIISTFCALGSYLSLLAPLLVLATLNKYVQAFYCSGNLFHGGNYSETSETCSRYCF